MGPHRGPDAPTVSQMSVLPMREDFNQSPPQTPRYRVTDPGPRDPEGRLSEDGWRCTPRLPAAIPQREYRAPEFSPCKLPCFNPGNWPGIAERTMSITGWRWLAVACPARGLLPWPGTGKAGFRKQLKNVGKRSTLAPNAAWSRAPTARGTAAGRGGGRAGWAWRGGRGETPQRRPPKQEIRI